MNNLEIEKILEQMELNRDPMDKAVETNDLEFVKNNLNLNDDSVIYYSISNGKNEIFEFVFPLFNLESQRKYLKIIAYNNRFDYLNFALKYMTIDFNDSEPHELACEAGNFEMVKKLESLGIKKGLYSFYNAVAVNNLDLVTHLYDGEDISNCFSHQSTVMTLNILKFLMSKDDISANNKRKVLLGAASAGLIDVIDYLLKLPESVDSTGALFETVYFGAQLKTFKYFLTKAPILSKIDEDDYMALEWSYKHNYLEFVDYCINEHNITPETSRLVYEIMKMDNFANYNKLKNNKPIIF
jgi:hypothetical protein